MHLKSLRNSLRFQAAEVFDNAAHFPAPPSPLGVFKVLIKSFKDKGVAISTLSRGSISRA